MSVPPFEIDDELLAQLEGSSTVLAGTDEGGEPAFDYERHAAAALAARLGARLVLFDRSGETWGESDYEQLYELDQVEDAGRPHLVGQMREALDIGAPEVFAWGYALPALESLGRAIEETDADVIVTPEKLEKPSLGERWFVNRDLVARVQEQAAGRHVVVVQPDGTMWRHTDESDTGTSNGTEGGRPAPEHVA